VLVELTAVADRNWFDDGQQSAEFHMEAATQSHALSCICEVVIVEERLTSLKRQAFPISGEDRRVTILPRGSVNVVA
jgi:hypothetical protein